MDKLKRKRVWTKLKSGLYGWKSSVEKSSKTSNILPRTPSNPQKLQNTQTILKWLLTAREGGEGAGGGGDKEIFLPKVAETLPKLADIFKQQKGAKVLPPSDTGSEVVQLGLGKLENNSCL